MVCSDMAHGMEPKFVVTNISIVIMQIRNSLFFFLSASKLSDVMPAGRTGNKRKVNRNAGVLKLPRHIHRNIMNATHVAKCIKRCNVRSNPQEFIDIFLAYSFLKTHEFSCGNTFRFSFMRKMHYLCRVKNKSLFFIEKECSQDMKE